MHIAILGASSYIAKDLILSFSLDSKVKLSLFGRNIDEMHVWLKANALEKRYSAHNYSTFHAATTFDAIINFVGVGDPARAAAMGASILDVTLQYDQLVLDYLRVNPNTIYIFISSGAAYGSIFREPAKSLSKAEFDINRLSTNDYYGMAKLYAEAKHRSCPGLTIIDLRVFNYFSSTLNLSTQFFISDVLRAIRDKLILKTSSSNIFRDYLHPHDFYQLVNCVLAVKSPINMALDCYTKNFIDKMTLLKEMEHHFGLNYSITNDIYPINNQAVDNKKQYYSLNKAAELVGYFPTKTSLECLLQETEVLLSRVK